MDRLSYFYVLILLCLVHSGRTRRILDKKSDTVNTDAMENFINPKDLQVILDPDANKTCAIDHEAMLDLTTTTQHQKVECPNSAGWVKTMNKIFSFNLQPSSTDKINTHFYFFSRKMKLGVQVYPGKRFGLKSVDFDPKRKTVVIIHGFMSYSGADWVKDMTQAYLESEDVNVIAVDWSGGCNTLKYWRAVANTRTVGRDIANLLGQLKNKAGLNIKNCHFIGHSLGAQIASFASFQLGKVARITGLDPAGPCFDTSSTMERLDPSDADFVDVIHTNSKLSKIGFGLPYPIGHVDFYPNGGIKQPGCEGSRLRLKNKIDKAICSHGRAYTLFTETLSNKNCSFKGTPWDLTSQGLRKSVDTKCYIDKSLCPEMGIKASRQAKGIFLVITQDKDPYCVSDWERHHIAPELLKDITNYLQTLSVTETTVSDRATIAPRKTTSSSLYSRIKNRIG